MRAHQKFCSLVPVHFYFFTAAHFHIASISHFLTAAMKCSRFSSDEIRLLCFQSLTLALTFCRHPKLRRKIFDFVVIFHLKVRVAMRFPAK